MKTFSNLLLIFEEIKGHKTPEQIAQKHGVSLGSILKQLKIGVPIEHEHTKDNDLATDIALQHLGEFPDYYTRLTKLETSAKKSLGEDYTKIQKTGNTYTILASWKGGPRYIQMFFPNMKRPTKEEVNFEINKIYPGAIVLSFKPSKIDPTKPYLFSGEIK